MPDDQMQIVVQYDVASETFNFSAIIPATHIVNNPSIVAERLKFLCTKLSDVVLQSREAFIALGEQLAGANMGGTDGDKETFN